MLQHHFSEELRKFPIGQGYIQTYLNHHQTWSLSLGCQAAYPINTLTALRGQRNAGVIQSNMKSDRIAYVLVQWLSDGDFSAK